MTLREGSLPFRVLSHHFTTECHSELMSTAGKTDSPKKKRKEETKTKTKTKSKSKSEGKLNTLLPQDNENINKDDDSHVCSKTLAAAKNISFQENVCSMKKG